MGLNVINHRQIVSSSGLPKDYRRSGVLNSELFPSNESSVLNYFRILKFTGFNSTRPYSKNLSGYHSTSESRGIPTDSWLLNSFNYKDTLWLYYLINNKSHPYITLVELNHKCKHSFRVNPIPTVVLSNRRLERSRPKIVCLKRTK